MALLLPLTTLVLGHTLAKEAKHEVIILSSHGPVYQGVIMLEQEKRRIDFKGESANSATLFLNETITLCVISPSWDNYSGILYIFQMLLFLSEGE